MIYPYHHWLKQGKVRLCLKLAPVDGYVFREALRMATLDDLSAVFRYMEDIRGLKTRYAALKRRIAQVEQEQDE